MLRIITLATAAAAIFGAPACAAESIRIATPGKTQEQLRVEVARAAQTVCRRETASATIQFGAQSSCVARTIRATFAQAALGSTFAQR